MKNLTRQVVGTLGVLTLGLALGGGHAAYAQRGGRNRFPPPSAVLASVTSLKCAFPASATATWESGQPQVKVQNLAGVFTLTIADIDAQEGTARTVGLGAPAEVTVKLAGSNLHILDIRPTGALAITTVFAEESHDGRLKAVHSRSDYVGGAGRGVAGPPSVSQYYGDCEAGSR